MQSLQQLRLVAALAGHGNFGRAAASLGISQPALTKAIRAIETALGVTLFDRGPPVTPTDVGRLVLNRGTGILAELSELHRELTLARGVDTGEIHIAGGTHTVDIAIYPALAALARAHPGLSCRLDVTDNIRIHRGVRAGRLDVGVCHIMPGRDDPELEVELLRVTPYRTFCAASHPLARLSGLTVGDLLHYAWVTPRGIRPRLRHMPAPAPGLPFGAHDPATGIVRPRFVVNTMSGIIAMVMSGDAISLAPRMTIAREVARGDIVVLDVDYPRLDLEYGFITRRGRSLSPGALAFMDQVRAVEAAIGREV